MLATSSLPPLLSLACNDPFLNFILLVVDKGIFSSLPFYWSFERFKAWEVCKRENRAATDMHNTDTNNHNFKRPQAVLKDWSNLATLSLVRGLPPARKDILVSRRLGGAL